MTDTGIKTQSEGGKGRKQCPACKQYVGNRNTVCACGHAFPPPGSASNEPKVVTTYEEGGLGKKKCPACQKFVGIRVRVCACSHEFVSAPKPTPPPKPAPVKPEVKAPKPARIIASPPATRSGIRARIVSIPAGECPVKLKGTDEGQVHDWITRLLDACLEQSQRLTVEAVKYFVRQFHDLWTDEHALVCHHIEHYNFGHGSEESYEEPDDEVDEDEDD